MSVSGSTPRVQQASTAPCCEHCGKPVLVVKMRSSGLRLRLDPTPSLEGSLMLVEDRAQFIAPERRHPKSRWFVPAEERYTSHQVTCPRNVRTLIPATEAFIADVDRRLGGAAS